MWKIEFNVSRNVNIFWFNFKNKSMMFALVLSVSMSWPRLKLLVWVTLHSLWFVATAPFTHPVCSSSFSAHLCRVNRTVTEQRNILILLYKAALTGGTRGETLWKKASLIWGTRLCHANFAHRDVFSPNQWDYQQFVYYSPHLRLWVLL